MMTYSSVAPGRYADDVVHVARDVLDICREIDLETRRESEGLRTLTTGRSLPGCLESCGRPR